MGGIQEILSEQSIDTGEITYLAHGTTVATNALIEKKGARMGLITTEGLKSGGSAARHCMTCVVPSRSSLSRLE